MGECGKRITVRGRAARCWRKAGHPEAGGHTPDGFIVKYGNRTDDRPEAMRPTERRTPTDPPETLTEDELAAGRALRERARR